MSDTLHAASTAAIAARPHCLRQPTAIDPPAPATGRAGPRVVVISLNAFHWLRDLQHKAPAPRLDMRYYLEGVTRMLREHDPLRHAWLDHSRNAMFQHLAHIQQRHSTSEAADGPLRTAGRLEAGEGAPARTPQAPPSGPPEHRLTDCKALQLGEEAFQWLKGVQGTTRDPRIEFRYLLDGAFVLLQQRQDLLPAVVEHARQALAEHLEVLRATPVRPIHMEHKP